MDFNKLIANAKKQLLHEASEYNKLLGESVPQVKEVAKRLKSVPDTTIKGKGKIGEIAIDATMPVLGAILDKTGLKDDAGEFATRTATGMPGEIARSFGRTTERVGSVKGREEIAKSAGRVATTKPGLHTLNEPVVEDTLNIADLAMGGMPGLTIKTVKQGARQGTKTAAKKLAEEMAEKGAQQQGKLFALGGIVEPITDASRLIEAPKVYKGHSDYTTKTLKALKGKTTVPKGEIIGTMNKLGVRPVERNLIEQALAKVADNKVGVNSLAEDVHSQLPKFERRDAGTQWQDYSLGGQLEWDTDYKVYTTNVPGMEWEDQNFHFNTGEGQLAHSRIEDVEPEIGWKEIEDLAKEIRPTLKIVSRPSEYDEGVVNSIVDATGKEWTSTTRDLTDMDLTNMANSLARSELKKQKGGTRVLTELQSDLMQEGKYKKELPPSEEDLRADLLKKIEYTNKKGQQVSRQQKMMAILPEIIKNERLIPGKSWSEQPIVLERIPPPNQLAIPETPVGTDADGTVGWMEHDRQIDQAVEQVRNELAAKYGVSSEDIQEVIHRGDPQAAVNELHEVLESNQNTYRDQLQGIEQLQAKIANGMQLTPEEQGKKDLFDAMKGDNWWKFKLRDEIHQAAVEGKDELLVPKGDTIAKVEQYVRKGEEGRYEYGDYSPGDTVYDNYEGEDRIVLDTDGNSLQTIGESDIQNRFNYDDARQEEIDNIAEQIRDDLSSAGSGSWHKETLMEYAEARMSEAEVKKLSKYLDTEKELPPALQEKVERIIEDMAENQFESDMGDPESMARYMTENYGTTYIANDDEIIVLKENAEPSWDDMSDEGGGGYPENIADELSSDQMNVYDFYDKKVSDYLKKLRGEEVDTNYYWGEPNGSRDNEMFTRVPLKPEDAEDGVEVFNKLPPFIMGGALLGGGAMAGQGRKENRY